MDRRRSTRLTLLCAGLLGLAGCLPSEQAPVGADFRASDTPSRVPAIVDAAETDDQDALFELVHALSDKDPAVRLFAIRSLQERTGETFGYRYYEPADKRQAATDRWHQWLDEQAPVPDPVLSGYDAVPTAED